MVTEDENTDSSVLSVFFGRYLVFFTICNTRFTRCHRDSCPRWPDGIGLSVFENTVVSVRYRYYRPTIILESTKSRAHATAHTKENEPVSRRWSNYSNPLRMASTKYILYSMPAAGKLSVGDSVPAAAKLA